MKDNPKQGPSSVTERVREMLQLTRDREMDCDEFAELLAGFVDGSLTNRDARSLMDHHRQMCPECEEEHQMLRLALGRELE